MDGIQIDRFRQHLLQLRTELLELSSTSDDAAKPVQLDQAAIGRLTRMDAMRAQGMAIETRKRREQLLLKIKGALNRIDTGEYGICLKCGEEIDVRRLEADPSYTTCIRCADI